MHKVNMHEAKTHLSKLVRLALEGEDVVLARNGEPVVRLVPVRPEGLRPIGLHRLPDDEVTDEFLAETMRPLSAEELETWTASPFPGEKGT